MILSRVYFGNTVLAYLIAAGTIALVFVGIQLIKAAVNRLIKRNKGSKLFIDALKVLEGSLKALYLLPIMIIGDYINMPPVLATLIKKGCILLLTLAVLGYISNLVTMLSRGMDDKTLANTIRLLTRLLMGVFGILFIMANLGVNVSTLIAGIGIGGMAFAFAAKSILEDLFNYFFIIVDRRFDIGDYITIGEVSGTVLSIGIRGTRVRALTGEMVVISNTAVTGGVLRNFTKMSEVRVTVPLSIKYDTESEVLDSLKPLLQVKIDSFEGNRFFNVFFKKFDDSALLFELVYFIEITKLPESVTHHIRSSEVNHAVAALFAEKKIEFAFPSQSIYMEI